MELTLLFVALALLVAVLVLLVVLLMRRPADHTAELKAAIEAAKAEHTAQLAEFKAELKAAIDAESTETARELAEAKAALTASMGENIRAMSADLRESIAQMSRMMNDSQTQSREAQAQQIEQLRRTLLTQQQKDAQATLTQLEQLENRMKQLETSNEGRMNALRETLEKGTQQMRTELNQSMTAMRTENGQKLDEMRRTVDEKLQETLEKRITESFKAVNDQLEQVYKGLGEMQTLASDVGGLKQVLSGVKTRGILGEIQLGAILEEILAPEQYETNVATIPGSSNRVEYAVRLPGADGGCVYLPIDSKFPGDTFAQLQEASLSGDAAAVAAARKALENTLKNEAKDISSKYVEPPYTTNFGIMFLPFEGLYAEVVNMGLLETLQRDYHVNVAGPSTMAALLNSLQMGFRTLAIQKRSNEVWNVLGAVKTEFAKFEDGLLSMRKHLDQTGSDLDKLMNTRTRQINRKLKSVQALDGAESVQLLALDDESSLPLDAQVEE